MSKLRGMTTEVELVVLADSEGNAIGTAPKATVHTKDTPLHFAFSTYILNPRGELLVTRRALSKKTWPGVWTNSMCGHPGPDETNADAIRRRGVDELGLEVDSFLDIQEILPDYQYRAVDASGIVEWELCPVHLVRLAVGEFVEPLDDEVEEFEWVEPQKLFDAVDATPFVFSPWLVDQLSAPELRQAILEAFDAE
ncbi:isopentenyl-diphosphate Delta-isomerase [Corynebacterium glutamicum]|nr:isopentenyl-diphosphate Delta-isomerase [Corynebacterium glutamicum ATCC 14067]QDQ21467.1 isopentenyl-diphosphate Delta-isomerase [Corynebacterium glutamicum]QDQ22506.1 isopentenyl-diphosphate Delta-isomerase [Corynebacterium glutamicum]QWQ84896.1 isopentenyl-diphosphate delta-isomerase [Corynebacterium glutamicum]BCB32831.1 isopentenyl-diphosphate Delta-isomerase [Corynebacterium glutamicum]